MFKKQHFHFWLIPIIAVLFASVTTIYYSLKIYFRHANPPTIAIPTIFLPSPTPSIAIDETANWKTYTATDVGFTLKYPGNFFFKEYSTRGEHGEIFGVSFADKKWENQGVHNPSLIVRVITAQLPPRNWLEENYDPAVLPSPNINLDPPYGYNDVQDTTFDGMVAVKFQFLTASDGSESIIIQGSSNKLYRIDAISSGIGDFPKEQYNQILSTFKFLALVSPTPSTKISKTTCVVGGCSGELCLDESSKDTVSICIYRSEWACYKTAKCEKQIDGKCGWTQTDELKSCLAQNSKP